MASLFGLRCARSSKGWIGRSNGPGSAKSCASPRRNAGASIYSVVGKLLASDNHRARELQQESIVGETPGSSKREPAGMMISRPLRVLWGSGEPHSRQKEVEKLRASGRSKRDTCSGPHVQRKAGGRTYAFVAKALPVALRHREQ
jgi:hypothetical protein